MFKIEQLQTMSLTTVAGSTHMKTEKTQEILRSIIEFTFGSSPGADMLPLNTANDEWRGELSCAIHNELGVDVTRGEIKSAASLPRLSMLVEQRLPKDLGGRSAIDIYAALEEIARSELHNDISFHWYARWQDFSSAGSWLSAPDGLDYVELVMHMEEAFGFSIPSQDAEAMQTVRQTVRYIFDRSCEQNFVLRQPSKIICQSAFVFHEIRRLMVVRGGVVSSAIRVDARLGDLLPSWHIEFWKQVQSIFGVTLPSGNPLAFGWRLENRTTVGELVNMLVAAQKQ